MMTEVNEHVQAVDHLTGAIQSTKRRLKAGLILTWSYSLAVLVTVIYIILYIFEPLGQPWNDNAIYGMILIAAWLAAIFGTFAWRQFARSDPPRRIWAYFSLALWSWALGELVWLALHPFYEEFPDVFYFDFFWFIAYIFFALAAYEQYKLIYQPTQHEKRSGLAFLFASLLIIPLAVALLLRQLGVGAEYSFLGLYLYVFYPVGDLLVGAIGVHLSRLFGRGVMGRAWWGLVAFALSDGISTWYDLGGYALLSEKSDLFLSVITDTLYFGAYILFALAALGQLLLLLYGPPLHRKKNQATDI
jgi:hypothetical protein